MFKDKNILVGVTGGIAAYKAAEIISHLKKAGANIDVIMTQAATKIITPLTLQTLSKNRVVIDMFAEPVSWEVQHIALADKADLCLVAPATANIIGKVANGIADDMLSTTIMATKAPVVFAPAMNVNMYLNPIVQENISKLKERGYSFIEPAEGLLACGYEGKGRLAETDVIVNFISGILSPKDLLGKKILVTAGPTREAIDPVRYITNRSSGKMGYAIADAAAKRGAEVFLITGPTNLKLPCGVSVEQVETTEEMYRKTLALYHSVDIVIKAAAVLDYRPKYMSEQKIKKSGKDLRIEFESTVDILEELGKQKRKQILAGFAAESEALVENALRKIHKKNLDLIIVNNILEKDAGFDVDTNRVKIIDALGRVEELPLMKKEILADKILDRVKTLLIKQEDGIQ